MTLSTMILYWYGEEKRITTGAELLRCLLRGIVGREPLRPARTRPSFRCAS